MDKNCKHCGGTGYILHGFERVTCECKIVSNQDQQLQEALDYSRRTGNAMFSPVPIATLIKSKMENPEAADYHYIGQGIYQGAPAFVFSLQEMKSLCAAVGLEYTGPQRWDSEMGWLK